MSESASAFEFAVHWRKALAAVPSHFMFSSAGSSAGGVPDLFFLAQHPERPRGQQCLWSLSGLKQENAVLKIAMEGLPSCSAKDASGSGGDKSQPTASAATSKEEELRRERMRMLATGMTNVSMHPRSGLCLATQGGQIVVFDPSVDAATTGERKDATAETRFLEIVVDRPGAAIVDAKWNPAAANPSEIVFTMGSNLYAVTFSIDQQDKRKTTSRPAEIRQLTFDAESELIRNGVADYIMQEEFDRYDGFWISPDGRWLLYCRVDDTRVQEVSIPTVALAAGESEQQQFECHRYPFVGTPNPAVSLRVLDLRTSSEGQPYLVLDELLRPFSVEYWMRLGWISAAAAAAAAPGQPSDPASDIPTIFLDGCSLDQCQRRLLLLQANESGWTVVGVHAEDAPHAWINVDARGVYSFHGRLFLTSEQSEEQRLLYEWRQASASEDGRSSAVHLLTPRHPAADDSFMQLLQIDADSSLFFFDHPHPAARGMVRVYFLGNSAESPMQRHVFVYDEYRNRVFQVTTSPVSHVDSVAFDESGRYFVCTWSSPTVPPQATVFSLSLDDGSGDVHCACPVFEMKNETLMEMMAVCPVQLTPPSYFSFEVDSGTLQQETLYGAYYFPSSKSVPESVPVVVSVYGGPHVQLVRESFGLTAAVRHQWYAQRQNICVVVVDNRGSFRRGRRFEGYLHKRMGQMELLDQIAGLRHLHQQMGLPLRMDQVGITGFSYGGYLSLMAMARHSDFFLCAVAGAPVVDWKLYDTGYTERYQKQWTESVYKAGNVLTYARGFPDQYGRLMLVHGMMDENVLFRHTQLLLEELARLNKPYSLVAYPSERHGIRAKESAVHFESMTLQFFLSNFSFTRR